MEIIKDIYINFIVYPLSRVPQGERLLKHLPPPAGGEG
jgi:hypothetical protein